MFCLKGHRFGFPLIRRYGVQKENKSHPISRNRHSGLEIHYVLKGEVTWEIDGFHAPLRVPGGNFGIIPNESGHHALEGSGTPAVRVGVIFSSAPERQTKGTPFSAEEISRIFARFSSFGGTGHRFTPRLAATLRELSDTLNFKDAVDPNGILRLRVLSAELVYETYRILGEPESLAAGHDVVPKIRKWIDDHLSEDLSVGRLIKLSGYGRSRFYALFLSDTGLTPNDYILRARVRKAKKLLATRGGAPSMTDIAMQCGFSSSSTFSKSFRKVVAKSPREFASRVPNKDESPNAAKAIGP